jgi:hypothetical protein
MLLFVQFDRLLWGKHIGEDGPAARWPACWTTSRPWSWS